MNKFSGLFVALIWIYNLKIRLNYAKFVDETIQKNQFRWKANGEERIIFIVIVFIFSGNKILKP